MSKKLNYALKYFRIKIQGLRLKWRKLGHELKHQRGLVICRLIHIVFLVITTTGTLPFRVTNLEKGFRQLIPIGRKRQAIIKGLHIYMILGAVFYTLLPLSSKVKLAMGGNLTADCLIWVFGMAVAAAPAILSWELLNNHRDFAFVYNSAMEIIRAATRKHLKGQHIFYVVRIRGSVVCLTASACAVYFLIPFLATLAWIPLRDSPVLITYHIAGPYVDMRSDDTLGLVLYWVGSLLQWIYFNYVGWFFLMMSVAITEVIIAATLLFKMIRSLEPEQISWTAKLKIHAQAELVIARFNELVGLATPITMLVGFILAVCSFIALMMVDPDAGFPSVTLIPVLAAYGVGTLVGGCIFLKFAEEFRANSIRYLKETEDEITSWIKLKYRRRVRRDSFATGRTFRRRPIGVRLGMFMWMDTGISVSYVVQIVEKAINYFFMVDLRSQPVWLW